MKTVLLVITLAVAAAPVFAEPAASKTAASPPSAEAAHAHAADKAATPVSAESLPNSGKVLDVIDTDLYSYIEVTNNSGSIWLATTKVKVAKGDMVRYGQGSVMNNFPSRALNRTFPSLMMVEKVVAVKN